MSTFRLTAIALLSLGALLIGTERTRAELVYYWDFDNDTTAYTGTGTGSVTEEGTIDYIDSATGLGRAASFDGTNDVLMTGLSGVLDFSEISISIWFRSSAGNWKDWWCIGTSSANLVLETNNTDSISMYNINGVPGASAIVGTTVVRPDSTGWHCVTWTASESANETKLYLDGVQEGTTRTWSASGNIDGLALASRLGDTNRRIVSDIDEFRIYDTALSESQVIALANVPEPSTLLLTFIGVLAFCLCKRRAKRNG